MQLLDQSCILLKVMRLLFILCALIAKKISMWGPHLITSFGRFVLIYLLSMDDLPSVCLILSLRFHVQFVFSTSVDGQIKAWLYEVDGPRVNYDAPSLSCTTMVYSADGKRLVFYSCSNVSAIYVSCWQPEHSNLNTLQAVFMWDKQRWRISCCWMEWKWRHNKEELPRISKTIFWCCSIWHNQK